MGRWCCRAPVAVALGAIVALWSGVILADPGPDDTAAARLDPDYAAGRHAIAMEDWPTAIARLTIAAGRADSADIENYLGYAYRHVGQLDLAFSHYARALQIDPSHRGAHEYVGEAYLMIGDLAKAEQHLAELRRICAASCEEYEDLRKAIADHRARARE